MEYGVIFYVNFSLIHLCRNLVCSLYTARGDGKHTIVDGMQVLGRRGKYNIM